MSKNFNKIKNHYDSGFWNENRVKNMVIKGHITEKEFEMIVGKKFEE